MICPVCQTNNAADLSVEFCVQCGADVYVHRLLRGVNEELLMQSEIVKSEPEVLKKNSILLLILQTMPSLILLFCAIFIIFVGLRFLNFLNHAESRHMALADRWSETGFEQLQEMNATIKQSLDLIVDQRRENQLLQEKIQALTKPTSVAVTPLPKASTMPTVQAVPVLPVTSAVEKT